MGGGLFAYATSAGPGSASRAVQLNRRWCAGAWERRCSCRRGRGWDEAATADGTTDGRPVAVRPAAAPGSPGDGAGRECSGTPPGLRGPEAAGTGAPAPRCWDKGTYCEDATSTSYHCQLILMETC